MVKKITGNSGASGTTRVQSTKTVESSKVGTVGQVAPAEKQRRASSIAAVTTSLSARQREQLLQMVDEEAEKIFGADSLPESKKESVKGAVKMAIAASTVEEAGAEVGEEPTPPAGNKGPR